MSTRKRYRDPETYQEQRQLRKAQIAAGVADPVPEPDFDEVEVVEVDAVEGGTFEVVRKGVTRLLSPGRIVKRRVYVDQVPKYERALERYRQQLADADLEDDQEES